MNDFAKGLAVGLVIGSITGFITWKIILSDSVIIPKESAINLHSIK